MKRGRYYVNGDFLLMYISSAMETKNGVRYCCEMIDCKSMTLSKYETFSEAERKAYYSNAVEVPKREWDKAQKMLSVCYKSISTMIKEMKKDYENSVSAKV